MTDLVIKVSLWDLFKLFSQLSITWQMISLCLAILAWIYFNWPKVLGVPEPWNFLTQSDGIKWGSISLPPHSSAEEVFHSDKDENDILFISEFIWIQFYFFSLSMVFSSQRKKQSKIITVKKFHNLKDTSKNISDFNIKGLVILDRRHHWSHKLQENNQWHMRFYFFAFRFGLLYESLHHFWMLTRVDCQHPEIELRHQFLSDCFILILGINVLEDLLRT